MSPPPLPHEKEKKINKINLYTLVWNNVQDIRKVKKKQPQIIEKNT